MRELEHGHGQSDKGAAANTLSLPPSLPDHGSGQHLDHTYGELHGNQGAAVWTLRV